MTVLRFDSVSKQYPGGHTALSDVSFAVDAGEMLFVTGHSGAGKSTLLKLIQLAERPSRGAVLFGDRNLLKVRGGAIARHRRSIGVVYQNHQLLMDRSVAENVALPLILRGMKRAESASACARCWNAWAWARATGHCPRSCPPASSSASASPVRWSPNRPC
jgi:cell division transport system ATP-binding protein